jgi:iron complex transport system substrate-binding protein
MDFERIAALKPDLVLAWKSGNAPADVERLEQLGYRVYVSEAARLADVSRVTRAIGTLAGTQAEAKQAAARFDEEIHALRQHYSSAAVIRVFYVVWSKPLMTVGGAHFISDVIGLCGGQNVFGRLRQLAPFVTAEAVIAAKPQAVLGGSDPRDGGAFESNWRTGAPAPLRSLPVFFVNPDLIQRPTLRIAEGAKTVCSALEQTRLQNRSARDWPGEDRGRDRKPS